MPWYFSKKTGLLIEAVQYDGSQESADKIKGKFADLEEMPRKWDNYSDGYFFNDPADGKTAFNNDVYFENRFTPIANRRALIIRQLQKYMLEKLEEHSVKGDEWKDETLMELFDRLKEEVSGVKSAIRYLKDDDGEYSDDYTKGMINNVLRKCADVANVSAMIADKAKNGELT
jgi:hypothetical protein